MSVTAAVLQGAKDPEALQVVIETGNSGVDLSTVTAAELETSTGETWAVDIESATASTITLSHVFDAEGLETEGPGVTSFVARLTTPAGVYRAGPFHLAITTWRT